ncbi:MAG: hypothetical protein ACOCXJ_04470 [Planctomycetota bacterium]
MARSSHSDSELQDLIDDRLARLEAADDPDAVNQLAHALRQLLRQKHSRGLHLSAAEKSLLASRPSGEQRRRGCCLPLLLALVAAGAVALWWWTAGG